jgi:hypothetical protein
VTRVFRHAYGSRRDYTRWTIESLALWQYLEQQSAQTLFECTGAAWLAMPEPPRPASNDHLRWPHGNAAGLPGLRTHSSTIRPARPCRWQLSKGRWREAKSAPSVRHACSEAELARGSASGPRIHLPGPYALRIDKEAQFAQTGPRRISSLITIATTVSV